VKKKATCMFKTFVVIVITLNNLAFYTGKNYPKITNCWLRRFSMCQNNI